MRKKNTSSEDELRPEYDFRTTRIVARGAGRAGLSVNDSQEGNTLIGEVRVKVKLTNAGDEIMVRRGLLTADKIRSYEADALVDTGAVRSVLPIHVVQRLGLAIVGKTRAIYANDTAEDVDVSEVVGIDIDGRRTTEETLVLGSEVLIGQTVLESLDLLVDCVTHRVIPNPAHPDQPVIKIKRICRAAASVVTVARSLELVNMSDWYPFKNEESIGQTGSELQRIVEFLNEQMDPAEVLAVEIKQFTGQGLRSLAPRVIGQTAKAQQKKNPGPRPKLGEDEFFQILEENTSRETANLARKILVWSKENFSHINWREISFAPVLEYDSYSHIPISVSINGNTRINFGRMKKRIPAFRTDEKRLELLRRLNDIRGIDLPPGSITRNPKFPLTAQTKDDTVEQFLKAIAWTMEEIKAAQS